MKTPPSKKSAPPEDEMEALVVIATVPDENLAVKVTAALLQQGLAACVHALPAGKSTYRWQGNVETASEITLLIKTRSAHYAELEAVLTRLHPYDVPEILALTVIAGLPAYLNWIMDETSKN